MRGEPFAGLRERSLAGWQQTRSSARLMVADALLVSAAWLSALLLRYDGEPPAAAVRDLIEFLPLVLSVTLLLHAAGGLYSGVLRFASVREARQILVAQCLSTGLLVPLVFLLDRPVPLSVPIIAAVLACGSAGAIRFWSRLLRQRTRPDGDVERLVVVGGGEAGSALIRSVQDQPGTRVVAVVDDDRALQGLRIHGVRVQGALSDLRAVIDATGATRAVLAISAAGPELVRRLVGTCGDLGVALSVVPAPAELLGRQVSLQDARDLEITDLLGRPPVDTDLDEVVDLIRGRRVLITGGGGSIGSELARQVASFGPVHLVILDHDETHLFDAAAALPPTAVQRLADIRDADALSQVFQEERPEIVFHAAALKHVPILESHPVQALATNVLGTRNVLDCASAAGVSRLVQISTDKAVRPSSVMGTTKLACEHLVLADHGLTTCAVRFGNVLGSRGSVVPTFIRQIRAGGPVTITDGRMTRYFMSIPEAVRLVLHAAALSQGGEIFMLDMGEPVRIHDLASRMIRLSGQRPGADVEIKVTSVRPGEKLDEELHAPEEIAHSTSHPSIYRLEPVHLAEDELADVVRRMDRAALSHDAAASREALARLLALRARRVRVVMPSQRHGSTNEQTVLDAAWT